MAWFSFHCECQNKVGLGIYFIKNAKIWYAKDLFIENAEVRYGWIFILLKRPK